MGAGAWKVAYADFVTAMMAFFLLMWILNMVPKDTLTGLAGVFKADATQQVNQISPVASTANNPILQNVQNLDTSTLNESEQSAVAIIRALNEFLMQDPQLRSSSGITTDGVGVLLHITPDLMFKPDTVEFSADGEKVMEEVLAVLHKYKSFLIVQGHADQSETGAPNYPSKWELSAARANAAVRYLVEHGINPTYLRSVSYADTKPKVPAFSENAKQINGRVEFNFHRPEVMSTTVGY